MQIEDTVGYFSNQLYNLIQGGTQQPIAEASGLARGTISLYATGARNISVGALEKLLKAFPDPAVKFSLLHAYLLDHVPPSEFKSVTIEPREEMIQEAADAYQTMDKELGATMAHLQQAATRDEDIRKVLVDLANIIR